ncbi:uncharacterized protein N7525_004116 [Penicillium rubens]|uniref:uncharacterized protein n=1 Tax=Penicillium rubens TaxID=1108849 RepID=UPI002A5A4B61|nr:uncharacterized protein N7525_004116 [Penicillium rubens]KAJ5838928.1 hypothetical protein N7525_004116 [Penicillium rubens]
MATSIESHQPLVRGGHARQPDELPSMFVSSTVPVVYENTIILGATHPTLSTADPKDDGWFISDFYAFNYLFRGLGMEQTWLTAVEPAKLVDKYGPYLHGNPYEERKICLSQELLDNDELSPVKVVRPANMIDQFLTEAKRVSELAKRTSAHVLLLIFCHGLPGFDMLLDNGNRHKGLSVTRLKGVLEPGARVTLITTAYYSGGWVTNPEFNYTTMAAADTIGDQGTSNAWGISHSIGRSCGSVFATTIVESLSSATSPLLDPSDRSQPRNSPEAQATLQPDEPEEDQTMTYNAFCHSVWRICEQRVTRLWDAQGFRRTGVPLADFERRWKKLASYPYTGPADIRDLRNTHLDNPTFLEADPARTASGQDVLDEMTDNIAHGRVKAMARFFHQTCPGD